MLFCCLLSFFKIKLLEIYLLASEVSTLFPYSLCLYCSQFTSRVDNLGSRTRVNLVNHFALVRAKISMSFSFFPCNWLKWPEHITKKGHLTVVMGISVSLPIILIIYI